MADAFIGEIRLFTWNWFPDGWLPCDGRSVSIQQYTPLFALIGNIFNPNNTSKTVFNLPNLTNQVAVGAGTLPGGSSWTLGKRGGSDNVTLNAAAIAAHNHSLTAAVVAPAENPTEMSSNPAGSHLSRGLKKNASATTYENIPFYNATGPVDAVLAGATVGPSGGGQGHENRQPFLPVMFCINYDGIFPALQ